MTIVRTAALLVLLLLLSIGVAPGRREDDGNVRHYAGYLVVGPETTGFISKQSLCRFWFVTSPFDDVWAVMRAHFDRKGLSAAEVEIDGALGTPAVRPSDYDDAIEVIRLRYIRAIDPDDLRGTAAIDGDCPNQHP